MGERRETQRQLTTDHEVRCLTELSDGTVLEGTVNDYSTGGARIGGSTEGLYVGDEVRLTFVFRTDERVRYEGMVIYLQQASGSFGVEFLSEPEPIAIEDMNAERLR